MGTIAWLAACATGCVCDAFDEMGEGRVYFIPGASVLSGGEFALSDFSHFAGSGVDDNAGTVLFPVATNVGLARQGILIGWRQGYWLLDGADVADGSNLGVSDVRAYFGTVGAPDGVQWVRPAGDLTGDGSVDFVARSACAGTATLSVCVLSGSDAPTDGELFHFDDAPVAVTDLGADVGCIVPIGDVDGDGRDDLVVHEEGVIWFLPGGAVPTSGVADIASLASARIVGTFDSIGSCPIPAGDVDGDGRNDLWVPEVAFAESGEPAPPIERLYTGALLASGGELQQTDAITGLEHDEDVMWVESAAAGDVDGDGLGDLAIVEVRSERGPSGRHEGAVQRHVAVYSGATLLARERLARTDALSVFVESACSTMTAEQVVASAGDLDGDGLSDLLVSGTWENDGAGAVWLIPGYRWTEGVDLTAADATLVMTGSHPGEEAGWSVVNVGDLDGDGAADFAVGAPGFRPELLAE